MNWDSYYMNGLSDDDLYGNQEDELTDEIVSTVAWIITLLAAVTGCALLVQAFPLEAAWLIAQF